MDFDYRKLTHIFAYFLILCTILAFIIFPLIDYYFSLSSTVIEQYENMSKDLGNILDIFNFITQILFAFVFLVLIPLAWYIFVNSISIKKALYKMKLRFENIDNVFLWGILGIIIIFITTTIFAIFLQYMGFSEQELSNIPDIKKIFPNPFILFLLVALVPIPEEIFFRGFLLDKIESFAGNNIAIILTSVLFGIAHLTYNKIYPALMIIIVGLVLGLLVVKTKNLFTSIFAHIGYNVIGMIISYLFGLY